MAGEPPQQVPIGIKHVDEAVARACNVVVLLRVLLASGLPLCVIAAISASNREIGWPIRFPSAGDAPRRPMCALPSKGRTRSLQRSQAVRPRDAKSNVTNVTALDH